MLYGSVTVKFKNVAFVVLVDLLGVTIPSIVISSIKYSTCPFNASSYAVVVLFFAPPPLRKITF